MEAQEHIISPETEDQTRRGVNDKQGGFNKYRCLVRSDLYRHTAKTGFGVFLKGIMLNPGFQYTFWMRTCAYTRQNRIFKFVLFPIARVILNHYIFKYGIDIPFQTQIGSGFFIGHIGGIVVNGNAVIGKNCNISHGVTLGESNRGKRKGYPVIGDHVYIGPGAMIVGSVRIGNHAAIGANCVVTKDVPDQAVVVGVPAKIISYEGSRGYINKVDYE